MCTGNEKEKGRDFFYWCMLKEKFAIKEKKGRVSLVYI